MKILVTGANGFVGSALCPALRARGIDVVPVVRNATRRQQLSVGNIGPATHWESLFNGADVVVHLAARVHVMDDQSRDPLAMFRAMNVAATINLARQAARCGVKRFIFVSSAKVNGDVSRNSPFSVFDQAAPAEPYGVSKMEAEQALRAFSETSSMQLVIVRPPLVYGPGVRANFRRLMQLAKLRIVLPFASINNRRSMVALDNLVDLLITCAQHPAASGQTFMASDCDDVSTPELFRMLAHGMGRRTCLLPCPVGILHRAAGLLGQSATASRLFDSFQLDMRHTISTLGWAPVVSVQQAINDTCTHFMAHR